jgi:hypothetical protein
VFRIAPLQDPFGDGGLRGRAANSILRSYGRRWSYQIKDVPDGSYNLKVWHPRLKAAQKSVIVKGATEASFEIAK